MLQSPIGWVGGKRLLRPKILKLFPEHTTYIEVFCGAAWVLFGKEASVSKAEVLNDRHGDLTNFFRCVREKPLELLEKLRFRLASQEDFRRDKQGLVGQAFQPVILTEVQRAARFFWLLRQAFGDRTVKPSFGYRLSDRAPILSDYIKDIIERAHERLAATLKHLKGKFLLSYNDHAEIRKLYKWAEIEQVTTRYSLARKVEARKRVNELLIRNYA